MTKYARIKEMRQAGFSYEQIANEIDTSTEYVKDVLGGKTQSMQHYNLHRCAECGGMVYNECRLCRIRKEMEV